MICTRMGYFVWNIMPSINIPRLLISNKFFPFR